MEKRDQAGGRGCREGKEGREIMLVFFPDPCHLQPGATPGLPRGEAPGGSPRPTPRMPGLPLGGSMLSTDNNPEGISQISEGLSLFPHVCHSPPRHRGRRPRAHIRLLLRDTGTRWGSAAGSGCCGCWGGWVAGLRLLRSCGWGGLLRLLPGKCDVAWRQLWAD